MSLELYQTSKHSRLYREVMPDGSRQGYMTSTLGPMNYESVLDSGDFNTPVDMAMRRVTNAQLDGYLITDSGWHYALQTVDPASSTIQPNQQSPIGTVGFGGRKGAHWFRFRLSNVGYIHWPTRDVRDLGGAPDYSEAPVVGSVTRNLGGNAGVPDDIQTHTSNVRWGNIWNTPGGGELSARWVMKADRLKEEIVINRAAREWLQANRPPTTPANETFFGFRFELDVSDIPRAYVNSIRQNFNSDFNDDEGGVALTDAADRLLAFMPLDFVYATGRGGKRNLRKRFYRQGNRIYLFVGVQVSELSGLLPGDLVFDPSMTQEAIAATADDCWESGGTNDTTPDWANTIFLGASGSVYAGGFRFTPNLPQGASLTGGGSEYATLSLYARTPGYFRLSGTPDIIIYGDDADNAGAWADGTGAERPNGSGFTATTASTTATISVDPGSNGVFNGGFDVAAIVEEIVGRGSWSANNGMRFAVRDNGSATEYASVCDFDGPDTEARLDAFYTTGGGPAGPNFLSLLGVG